MDSSIQLVEVGESFTLLATDSGKIYSFGLNDFHQLGRQTNSDEHISSVCMMNAQFSKQPKRVIFL